MKIVPGSHRPVQTVRYYLSSEERAYCWRIILKNENPCCPNCAVGSTADCDVNPLRPTITPELAISYLAAAGIIP